MITSAIWSFLTWILFTREKQKQEERVKEVVQELIQSDLYNFIVGIVFSFKREETRGFFERIENYMQENPESFQDSYPYINDFKAISSVDLLQDLVDIMNRFNPETWDEILKDLNNLKETMRDFYIHLYAISSLLEYAETVTDITNQLNCFLGEVIYPLYQWTQLTSEEAKREVIKRNIQFFQEILKLISDFMAEMPLSRWSREETREQPNF